MHRRLLLISLALRPFQLAAAEPAIPPLNHDARIRDEGLGSTRAGFADESSSAASHRSFANRRQCGAAIMGTALGMGLSSAQTFGRGGPARMAGAFLGVLAGGLAGYGMCAGCSAAPPSGANTLPPQPKREETL